MTKFRMTFDSIEEARVAFCIKICGGECVETCPMHENLKATGESCADYVQNHPFIASLTMNADIIEELEPDKTLEPAKDIDVPYNIGKPRLAEILGVEVGEKFRIQTNGGFMILEEAEK